MAGGNVRVLTADVGTKRTNWTGLVMSVDWGRPEAVGGGVKPGLLTQYASRHHAALESCPNATSAATVRVSTGNHFRASFPITLREQCDPLARTSLRRNSVRGVS